MRLNQPACDCLCLALAERERAPLVTLDQRLLQKLAATPCADALALPLAEWQPPR